MKNKEAIKILITAIIFIIVILGMMPIVYGGMENPYIKKDPIENPSFWRPFEAREDSSLNERVGKLLGYINVIGVVSSVILLMVNGIRYMIGSIEEKADYKKEMGFYLIGMVFVITLTTIPNLIYNLTKNLF